MAPLIRNNRVMFWAMLVIITLILLPGVFTSFEMCDSGFYLTFYDNVFSSPQSVEYNFMYYLSGLIGGGIDSMGDSGSMLRMRISGLLFLVLSALIAWNYSRGTTSSRTTAVALICVFAGYASSPIILSYDIVTILLLSTAVTLLTRGIAQPNRAAIFIAGSVTGILLFARIPNLLQFFLIILIPVYSNATARNKWILSALFAGGYLSGIIIIVILMACLGHADVFLQNMATLINLSADPEASHGLGNLISTQFSYYLYLLKLAIKLSVMALCLWGIWNYIIAVWLRALLTIPFGAYFIYIANTTAYVVMIGAVVIPALLIMSLRRNQRQEALIAGGALLSAIILPLGSDGAGENVGSILYILGVAPALGFWLKLRIPVKGRQIFIPRIPIWGATSLFTLICIIHMICGGLYFDNTPVWEMKSMSSSPKLSGILMSESRKKVIDDNLTILRKYVNPGDTLFAYGSSPMLNYLTSTRPYMGNSWPEQVSAGRLEHLLKGEERKGNFPVVCVQRFRTIGESWGEPSDKFLRGEDNDSNVYHSAKKWLAVEGFLHRNGYRKAAVTSHFEIYTRQ